MMDMDSLLYINMAKRILEDKLGKEKKLIA